MKKTIVLFIVIFTQVYFANAQWQQTSFNTGYVQSFLSSDTGIFAGSSNMGIYLSTDSGISWTAMNTGLTNYKVWSLVKNGTSIFAGTNGDGVFLSTTNGVNWTSVNSGMPTSNNTVYTFAIYGADIFAGVYYQVYLSTDNGANWNAVNTGLPMCPVRALAISGTNIFAGTEIGGVYLSTDNGANWTSASTGLANDSILSLAISGSNIYAGTCNGVYLSNNNGMTWVATNTGLPNSFIRSLAVFDNKIFAGTFAGVFLSTDNGASWIDVNTGLTNDTIISLAVIDNDIYAGAGNSGIWKRPLSEISSIEEINSNESYIIVYPNPTISDIAIEFAQKYDIEISNIWGEIIKRTHSNSKTTTVDLSNFSNGVYIVRIKTDKEIVTKKIIKE